MAGGDELAVDLLPDVVLGKVPARIGALRSADMESLVQAVVQQGLNSAGNDVEDLHAGIVNRIERELLTQVMLACNNVQTKAATRLGINRNTLHKKLKEYDLNFE